MGGEHFDLSFRDESFLFLLRGPVLDWLANGRVGDEAKATDIGVKDLLIRPCYSQRLKGTHTKFADFVGCMVVAHRT